MPAPFMDSAVRFAALLPHAPVLVPAVGRERISEAAATAGALREAARRLVASEPQTLAVVSPHSPRMPGAFGIWSSGRLRGTLGSFGAASAEVDLPADERLASAIAHAAATRGLETWKIVEPVLDHGAVVPLWFLVEAGWDGPTVVLSLAEPGDPGPVRFGGAIAEAASACGVRVALLASGDMSHRLTPFAPAGYEPRAADFDRWLIETIRGGDYGALDRVDPVLESLAGEDALDSVLLAAGATGFDATGHEVLSYEGPFGVGYGVAILYDSSAHHAATQRRAEA